MRNEKFDYVLDFHQRTSSGRLFKFFSYLLGYGYFYHNHHHTNPGLVRDQGIIKPNIQRDLDFAWSFAKNLLLEQKIAIPDYLDWEPRITAKVERVNQVVIGIVATRQTKMWPLENYAKLIGLIRERNGHCRIVIPLSSSLQDKLLEKKLREFEPSQHVEFLYLPLRQLPFEIAKSRLYIGNDTGLKHLAVALGIATYTFFGPEEPMEWHPYLTRHQVFFEPEMPCRYEKAHFCGLDHCDHHTCLRSLSVEMVWERIKALI